MNVERLHDNRDTSVLGDIDLMSQIRGQSFPPKKEELNVWIRYHTLIPVVLDTVFTTVQKGHSHGPPSYEPELVRLLKEPEIANCGSELVIKLLIEVLKSKSHNLDAKSVEQLLTKLSTNWQTLHSEIKGKSFALSFDFCQQMTQLLEVLELIRLLQWQQS